MVMPSYGFYQDDKTRELWHVSALLAEERRRRRKGNVWLKKKPIFQLGWSVGPWPHSQKVTKIGFASSGEEKGREKFTTDSRL